MLDDNNSEQNWLNVKFETNYEKNYLKNQCKNLTNKLLMKKDISPLAKIWFKKASSIACKLKYTTDFEQALKILKEVSKANCSELSLAKATSCWYFSSLKSVLKDNLTYKIYNKYGEYGELAVEQIKEYSMQYNISQEQIFNDFVAMEVEGKFQLSTNFNEINNYFNNLKN